MSLVHITGKKLVVSIGHKSITSFQDRVKYGIDMILSNEPRILICHVVKCVDVYGANVVHCDK